ncbi:Ku protein [Streptomyces sp. DG1A-41]|uniref:non-homologous end joining protein Ku n=1 Tax=Streptomyces sp. DG1A-41 TaxID=3125779 RepID=UPI0030D52117
MAVRSGAGARLSARTSSHPLPGARAQLPSWPGGARGSSGGSSCPGTSGAARSASVGHRSYLRGQRYEDHSIRFHQYHLADMGRVRVRKYCEIEDREVDQGEIGKGYQVTKEQVIPISDEELRELPLPTAKAIEIVAFVPLESVDPLKIGEGCYLAPSGQVAAKPYKLLRMALDRSSKVAVAKYAWSGRERLGLLRGREDVIVLHAMRWPDEIRSPEELLPPSLELTDEEIDGALALMDTMTGEDLEGEEFQDTYTEALAQINEAKREHREPP